MTKKKDNTGFRNGKLFCFSCGTSQELPLPLPIDLAAEWMKGFSKVHSKCKQTWEEPKPAPVADMAKNIAWWIENGEHGQSSKTMLWQMANIVIDNKMTKAHPSDPSDLFRCYKLLEAVPQLKERLHMMDAVSPVWKNLIKNWDKLTELIEDQINTKQPNGLYELMKELGC